MKSLVVCCQEDYENMNKIMKKTDIRFSLFLIEEFIEKEALKSEKIIIILTLHLKDSFLFHLGRISHFSKNILVLNLIKDYSISFLRKEYEAFNYYDETSYFDFCSLLGNDKREFDSFLQAFLGTSLKPKILFLTGVPSTGKTTISYQILKHLHYFKMIEETDIIRDILVGYNNYIFDTYQIQLPSEILNHTFILDMDLMIDQCHKMKGSILELVKRQIRKGIPTIINGVHIIPELFEEELSKENVIYIQLYIHHKEALKTRIEKRDPNSHMLLELDSIFKTNQELREMFLKLEKKNKNRYVSLDVTEIGIEEAVCKILKILEEN